MTHRRIVAIAVNTFREAVRNRILYTLALFAIVLILSAVALGELTLGEHVRLTRDLGLYGIDIFGVIMAIFLGVNLLYKELQLKTVYAILPKPLHRWEFVVGKWLGMIGTLTVQVFIMGLFLQLTLWIQGAHLDAGTAKAIWLLYVNIVVITSTAVLFSAFSSPYLSGLFSLGVFVVGRSVPDIIAIGERAGGLAAQVVVGLTRAIPNLYLFMPSGTIIGAESLSVHRTFVTGPYILWSTAYGFSYSCVLLSIAIFIFRKRDFV